MTLLLRTTATVFACIALGSCSTVPDWSLREVQEHEITAVYDAGTADLTVTLPTSNDDLLVLELAVESPGAEESFTAETRLLRVPSGTRGVRVRCRYRVFRDTDRDPLPWPTPASLFPGAARIESRL